MTGSEADIDVLLAVAQRAQEEGRFADAAGLAREASTRAGDCGDTRRQAAAGRLLTISLLREQGAEAALTAAEGALQAATAIGDRSLCCELLTVQAHAYGLLGLAEEAFAALGQSRRLAEELNQPELSFWVWVRTAGVHCEIGEYARAQTLLRAATRWLPGLSDEAHAVASNNISQNAWFEARRSVRAGTDPRPVVEAALEYGRDAVDIGARMGNPFIEGTALMNLAMLHACIGDIPGATSRLDASLAIAAGGRYPALEMSALICRTESLLMADKATEALVLAGRALALAEPTGESKAIVELHELRSLALARLGRFEEALAAYRLFHDCENAVRTEIATTRARVLAFEFDLQGAREDAQTARAQTDTHRARNEQLQERNRVLMAEAQQLQETSFQDALTGLGNRRLLETALPTLFDRAVATGHDLCVALIDIDHFKAVNDTFGHAVGDQVLSRVATLLSTSSREADVVGRLGGEEFVIAYPDLQEPAAARICERLRRNVASADWSWVAPGAEVTVSVGLQSRADCTDVWRQIERADRAMYRAKAGGRNAVVVGSSAPSPVAS